MATRHALRLVQRRFFSSFKVLSEEEIAALCKKKEQEILDKLERTKAKGQELDRIHDVFKEEILSLEAEMNEYRQRFVQKAIFEKKKQEILEKLVCTRAIWRELVQRNDVVGDLESLEAEVNEYQQLLDQKATLEGGPKGKQSLEQAQE